VVPVFALWLPISYNAFAFLSGDIDPSAQGTSVPLIFFKGGDMAVHMVGAIAFLVLGSSTVQSARSILMGVAIGVPIVWTGLVAGAANRGALLTLLVGVAVVVALAPRSRSWLPLLLAAVVLATGPTVHGAILGAGQTAPTPTASSTPVAPETLSPSPTSQRGASPSGSPGASPRLPTSTPSARPTATPATGVSTPEPSTGRFVRVANAGFELGSPGRAIDEWTPFGVGTYLTVGDGGRGDTQFAEVNNTGTPYQARLTSSKFPFVAGEDIRVSLWAKAIRGSPTVEIYVNWYDRSAQRISSVFIRALATGGLKAWQEVVGVYTAPTGTTDAEVLLWEAAGNATLGIDDVTVRAGDFITEPPPVRPKGRPATLEQVIENILSVFGSSSDQGLEGTKQFRLAWWGTIVDYTFFGDYFWVGKGFGVNLADDDGFQSTVDHSLRAPHNSHLTVLARMGVPGFVFWWVIQAAFAIGLLRSIRSHRRAGDLKFAAVGGWLLAYWVAMMVDTSFDPFLEGPQGGIWFWTVVGLGLVIARLGPKSRAA
jgi:hypothetical protein